MRGLRLRLSSALHSVLAFEGDEMKTETRGWLHLSDDFIFYDTGGLFKLYVCTLQLSIISSVQTCKQARFRLIPESINSFIHTYLPTLTIFFPLHLDLAAPYHETSTYIAASASGGGKYDRR